MTRVSCVLFVFLSLVGFAFSVPATGVHRWQLVVLMGLVVGTMLLLRASDLEAGRYLALATLWFVFPLWSVPLWWPRIETPGAPGIGLEVVAASVGILAPLVFAAAGFLGFCVTFPERLVVTSDPTPAPDQDGARWRGWYSRFDWGGENDKLGRHLLGVLSRRPEKVWRLGLITWLVAVSPVWVWGLLAFDGFEAAIVAWVAVVLIGVAGVTVSAPIVAIRFAQPEHRPRWLWFIEGLNVAFLLVTFAGIALGVPTTYALITDTLLPEFWFDRIGAWSLFLAVCAVLAGVAMAVFYGGALDPRLAIKRTTLYGTLASLIVLGFALIESLVGELLISRLGLPGASSGLIAGGFVAFGFQPVHNRLKIRVDDWIDARLPATELASALRHHATILFSDIVGYTALTSESEDDALTMMSVFHRQARRAAEQNKGRLVKTIGDEVLLEFKEPEQAVTAAQQLTASFTEACEPLGLPAAQLRSGIHMGEVAKRRDGDLFGDAVNIASRLQGVAEPDQIIVSEVVADQLDADLEALGEKPLKNVPEPVRCYAVKG